MTNEFGQSLEKPRRTRIVHQTNPFKEAAMVRQKVRTKSKFTPEEKVMVVGKGGELLGDRKTAGFVTRRRVDATQFVKLYVDSVGAIEGLKTAGRKVFTVLYHEVRQNMNKDLIYMSFNRLDKLLFPMSRATYARGIQELKDCGFIANSPDENWFWLNPTYMWNGDLMAFLEVVELDEDAPPTLNRKVSGIHDGQQTLPWGE